MILNARRIPVQVLRRFLFDAYPIYKLVNCDVDLVWIREAAAC